MFSGTLRDRDRLPLGDGGAKVTAIGVFERRPTTRRARPPPATSPSCTACRRARSATRSALPPDGATISSSPRRRSRPSSCPANSHRPARAARRLAQLAEQDPLIDVRQDDAGGALRVALRRGAEGGHPGDAGGRVRRRGRLPRDDDDLHRAAARPGRGVRADRGGRNPFLATVGLRVEPAPAGTGVAFRLEVELGSMPPAFFKAVEETRAGGAAAGPHGWHVAGLRADDDALRLLGAAEPLARGFDKSMSSTAGDFRELTPLVLMAAPARGGHGVHEPVHRFGSRRRPTRWLAAPARRRGRRRAGAPAPEGAACVVEGEIPAARCTSCVAAAAADEGEGVLESEFSRYARRGR